MTPKTDCLVCGEPGTIEVSSGLLCGRCTTRVIDAWDRQDRGYERLFNQSPERLRELAATPEA